MRSRRRIDDNALTWSGGLTWSFGQAARIGASYSSGGTFAGQRTFPSNPAQSIELRTPPSMGAGVSIDPLPNLTLAADAVRARYSMDGRVAVRDLCSTFRRGMVLDAR